MVVVVLMIAQEPLEPPKPLELVVDSGSLKVLVLMVLVVLMTLVVPGQWFWWF